MSIKSAKQSLTRTNTTDRAEIRAAGEMVVFDGEFDPYYHAVGFHLSDSDYTVSVMTDWSVNKWENQYNCTTYARMDGRHATRMGPRSQHWATEYTYNGFQTYADTPQLRFGYNNFIIEFWIKLQKQNGSELYVMSKGAGAAKAVNTGWVIGINTSYQPFFFDGVTGVTITAGFVVQRDVWYHMAFVRTTTGTNGLTIYVNGALYVTGTAAGNYSDTGTLKIGRDRDSTIAATAFWGLMTDIRIQTGRVASILLATDATGLITCQSTVGFNINDRVMFTGTTQGGIVVGTIYFVKTIPSGQTFTMSTTVGGAVFVTTVSSASTLTANDINYTPTGATVGALPTGPLSMTGTNVVLSQSMTVPNYTDNLGRITFSTDMNRRIDSPFYVHSEQVGHGVGAITTQDKNGWVKVYDAIPTNTVLRWAGNFTVEAWIYGNCNAVITGSICGKGSSGWTFQVNSVGQLEWYDNTTALTQTDTRNRISVGAWYHVAAVRTSTSTGGFKMYVNGLMVYQGTLTTAYTSSDPLYLFTDRTGAATIGHWNGMICGLKLTPAAKYNPTAVSTGVTATDAYGVITCGSTDGFVPGDRVTFTGSQGGITAITYWIFSVLDSTRFTISTTQGGGQFVTSTSSASGVLTASLTPQFSVAGTAFLDTQMTVESDTALLIGTCGDQPVVNSQTGFIDKGQAMLKFWRRQNEVRAGGGAPYSRHGYSMWFPSAAQHQMKATPGVNTGDLTFGTNDFSIEFWTCNFDLYASQNNNSHILMDSRMAWNDTGIRIRRASYFTFDVMTSGKIVLTSNNNRTVEYLRTVNGAPFWGDRHEPNGSHGPKSWVHVCVQRVSSNLAIYINGVKNNETVYSTAITAPGSKIIIGNSNWSQSPYSSNYDIGMYGWMCDIRICNVTSAYGVDSKNPPTIPVPLAPMQTTNGCVLLIANSSPYLRDQSGRENRIQFEQTIANGASSWEVKHGTITPYQGVDFDHTTQIYGNLHDTYGGFTSSGANVRYNHTSGYNDFHWINRLTNPWTIELWFWIYQTGNVSRTASVDARTLMSNSDSAGHDGFQIVWNWNSSGSTVYGDIALAFRNANAPTTQYIGTTGGLAANGGEGFFKPYTWNHVAFTYDPNAGNKHAVFINGKVVVTRTAMTANNSTNAGSTYSFGVEAFTAGVRISKIARYNNDATTYTMPTSYPIDQYTWCQPSPIYPIVNDKKLTVNYYAPYGCMLSTHYKKFGNGSMKISNKESTTDNANSSRIGWGNEQGYNAQNALGVRDGDYTMECWAAWHRASEGGMDFSSAGYGNFLWTQAQNISVGVNANGYWKMQHVPSHLDSQHWTYNVGIGANSQIPVTAPSNYGYQLFLTNVIVAQPTLSTPNNFDHVVVMRKSGCYYFYINGIEMGIMYANQSNSYGQLSNTVYAPIVDLQCWDIYNAAGNGEIGGDGTTTAGRGWHGWIQDFRWTNVARYDTVAINGVPTMCHHGTEVPSLPTKLFATK